MSTDQTTPLVDFVYLKLTFMEASMTSSACRGMRKKYQTQIDQLIARFGDEVDPSVIADKQKKIDVLRRIEKMLRPFLDEQSGSTD